MNDLVAKETLLHKLCNTIFLKEGRNIGGDVGGQNDDACPNLFDKLCEWFEKELEHCLFTHTANASKVVITQ